MPPPADVLLDTHALLWLEEKMAAIKISVNSRFIYRA